MGVYWKVQIYKLGDPPYQVARHFADPEHVDQALAMLRLGFKYLGNPDPNVPPEHRR